MNKKIYKYLRKITINFKSSITWTLDNLKSFYSRSSKICKKKKLSIKSRPFVIYLLILIRNIYIK